MPVVTVNVPEPKTDPMLRGLLQEFRSVANALRGLKTPNEESSSKALLKVSRHQDVLLRSVQRMMVMMAAMVQQSSHDQPMHSTMEELKSSLSGFASDLKDALRVQPTHPAPRVTVKPQITVSMGGVTKRLDSLEQALVNATMRSRNRTFGSNY